MSKNFPWVWEKITSGNGKILPTINTQGYNMNYYYYKFLSKIYLHRLHKEIKRKIITIWRRGFIHSKFVSVVEYEYSSLPNI